MPCMPTWKRAAVAAVLEAGSIALEYFRQPMDVHDKLPGVYYDPVTAADRRIETLIREAGFTPAQRSTLYEILRVGVELQRAIEGGDPGPLLARVPGEGLRCGERVVPKARVARDLSERGSWLHGVFFGGPGFVAPAGTAPSLRALLRDAPEVQALVAFRRDDRAGPVGLPCLDFRARDRATPGVPLCFEQRAGRWWLTDSLYPCR